MVFYMKLIMKKVKVKTRFPFKSNPCQQSDKYAKLSGHVIFCTFNMYSTYSFCKKHPRFRMF